MFFMGPSSYSCWNQGEDDEYEDVASRFLSLFWPSSPPRPEKGPRALRTKAVSSPPSADVGQMTKHSSGVLLCAL